MFRPACIVALSLFCLAPPALADTALLVGNGSYENASRIRGASAVTLAETALRRAGIEVFRGTDLEVAEMRAGLSRLAERGESERLLIALSGHFVQSDDGETWFLGTDADQPDRGNVGGQGVALSTLMALAADAPGRAVIMLGTEDRSIDLGAGLLPGIAMPEPPQGVAVVAGTPRDIAQIAREELVEPGVSLADVLAGNDDLTAAGFLSSAVPFLPPEPAQPTPAPAISSAEQALWDAVSELDTEGAYQSYLEDYPRGSFVAQARARLDELRADPTTIAQEAEAALNLTRDERRQIQSDLAVLGHYNFGIDGLFGNGTREAVRDWQTADGRVPTGYLNARSVERLSGQASARRTEIEAEEAIRQAERERLDRAYWNATGQGTDEAGLRAYLGRYPDGLFADIAIARLAEIETARAAEAAEAEAAAWDFATSQDSIAAYEGYLRNYPEGEHVRDARNRLAELRGQPLPFPEIDTAALEAREAALNLPGITLMLIERRLDGMGYGPGQVDGRIDAQTRQAIRAFQDDEGLTPTGYLDQETLSQFLSDGIRVIIR